MLCKLVFLFLIFSNAVSANDADISVYVDLTHIYAPDGTEGTSTPLNVLVSNQAQSIGNLKHRLNSIISPGDYSGKIIVYDWTNIAYMKGFKKCDYSNSILCGIKNTHWTLKTVVTIGKKFSTITMKIYNEKGLIIAKSSKTAWGRIRWKPQWKLTKIKEDSGFLGKKSTEIFELWPPKMEELPPLLKPYHVHQSTSLLYLSINEGVFN